MQCYHATTTFGVIYLLIIEAMMKEYKILLMINTNRMIIACKLKQFEKQNKNDLNKIKQ